MFASRAALRAAAAAPVPVKERYGISAARTYGSLAGTAREWRARRPPALFRTARGWVGGASVPPSCPTRLPLPPRLCAASACTANPALFSVPLLCRVSLTWRLLPPTSPRRPRPPARASRPHRGNSPSGAVGRRLRQDQRGTPARTGGACARLVPQDATTCLSPPHPHPRAHPALRARLTRAFAPSCNAQHKNALKAGKGAH